MWSRVTELHCMSSPDKYNIDSTEARAAKWLLMTGSVFKIWLYALETFIAVCLFRGFHSSLGVFIQYGCNHDWCFLIVSISFWTSPQCQYYHRFPYSSISHLPDNTNLHRSCLPQFPLACQQSLSHCHKMAAFSRSNTQRHLSVLWGPPLNLGHSQPLTIALKIHTHGKQSVSQDMWFA